MQNINHKCRIYSLRLTPFFSEIFSEIFEKFPWISVLSETKNWWISGNIGRSLLRTFSFYVPSQVLSSAAKKYPLLHKQMYEPIVLLHLCWHPPFETTPPIIFSHSFTSETKTDQGFKQVFDIFFKKANCNS